MASTPIVNTDADGDVFPGRGPTEQVYLSQPFFRLEDVAGQEVRFTCWSIVVLTTSPRDADDVKAYHRGPSQGNMVVSIEKWRFPDVLREHMVTETSKQIFHKPEDAEACLGFRESCHNVDADVPPKMLIDVHFPNPVLTTVKPMNPLNIEYAKERSEACFRCGLQALYTTVPTAIFEVREIKHTKTGISRLKGETRRAMFRK